MYKSGIFTADRFCGYRRNHAVLLTAQKIINGTDVYVIKNSWGAMWGDKGYITMAIGNTASGTCGVAGEWNARPLVGDNKA